MLKERLITALVLVVLALIDIFFASAIIWEMTVLLLSVLAAWEWSSLAKVKDASKRVFYAAVVASFAWLAVEAFSSIIFQVLALIQLSYFVFYVVRYQLQSGQVMSLPQWVNLLIGGVSIVVFAYALVGLRELYGPSILLLVLLAIWSIDSGAYFAGRRFGQHKLAVHVSPGKTWEGVLGGALFTLIFLLLFMSIFSSFYPVSIVSLAVFLTMAAMVSVFGDLFESVLKRQAKIKDSGNLLPGHGGVLDRIDSLLLALPFVLLAWLFFPFLAPVV